MQAMLGGGGPQEDMFAKLDQMKEIITEVNTQFKDPVRLFFTTSLMQSYSRSLPITVPYETLTHRVGEDDIRLRMHLRVLVALRNRKAHSGIDPVRDRYAQHCR